MILKYLRFTGYFLDFKTKTYYVHIFYSKPLFIFTNHSERTHHLPKITEIDLYTLLTIRLEMCYHHTDD